MRISLVTPARADSLSGNRVTAARWAERLRELGHDVEIDTDWAGGAHDLLVALHACRSASAIERWKNERPEAPLVVVLTGTDVYGGLERDSDGARALSRADRIVALQPLAAERLPEELRSRVHVVLQSALPPAEREPPDAEHFDACVLAHLRDVKDPLCAARATRLVPATSRLRVVHAGEIIDERYHELVRREREENPRYLWLGALSPGEASQLLARSRVLVVSSRSEGGANVVSEAIAAGVPVVTSAIDGSAGLLGRDWPATYPVGDAAALASLLTRCETDADFLADLAVRLEMLQPLFTREAERASWAEVLAGL